MAVESFCLVCQQRDRARERLRETHKGLAGAGWSVELTTVDEARRRQAEMEAEMRRRDE